jgi:DNA replication protein DnaC|tara:strand:+ start:1648 stop:2424 length:777 start_codon:yes stop_codon:yes gene_type:complete
MQLAQQTVLEEGMKQLRLTQFLKEYQSMARQGREQKISYEEYLLSLSEIELEIRKKKQLERKIKEAKFPQLKTIEESDLKKCPIISKEKFNSYQQCEYIKKKENIIFLGKHGTGKSHISIMLGIEACRKGYKVLFFTAATLVNSLLEKREEKQVNSFFSKLRKYDLLILDEMGYLPFSQEGAQLLFQVFSDRYESGSMIITSNLLFKEWNQIFNDQNLTAALLDRLTHRCDIYQFTWDSLRLQESKNRIRKMNSEILE